MMTEEDEEVIFDQAGLLTNSIKKSPEALPKSRKACRLLHTFFLCAAFFGLGLCVAIPGPTLLDLQVRTNTSTEQISRIFSGRSIGYLGGSVAGGFLFDVINQNCLLAVTLLVTSVGTVAAPWSSNYLVLMGTFALQGVSMGFLDTGGNVACLHLWGRSSGPAMQALHFSFGLGAFVAPLIAEPFVTDLNDTHPKPIVLHTNIHSIHSLNNHQDSENHDRLHRDVAEDLFQQLVKRDTSGLNSTVKKVTKPITNAESLNHDEKIADGSKPGKIIKSLPKPNEKPQHLVSTTTQVPCVNITADSNGTQICLDDPTTTTVSSTTIVTTLPTTTSTPSTTVTTKATTITSTSTKPTTTAQMTPTKLAASQLAPSTMVNTSIEISNVTDSKYADFLSKVTDAIANLQSMTKVEFAYITIAAFLFLLSFLYAFVCCCDRPCTLKSKVASTGDPDSGFLIHKESRGFRVQILILLFLFYFLYVGMEVTYGGFIMTFTVRHLGWDKTKGALVTSVFWGAFAVGRGLAIFIARCLSPVVMLVADLVVTILSLGGLVMVLETNEQMLWFCTATLGIGMASIFPTGITWAERYMQVTGKAAAVFVVGSALGEMAVPVLTGYLFDKKGPMCLIYILLAAAILASIIYIVMQNLASNKGERYQRLNTLMNMAHSGDEETEIESTYIINGDAQQESDSGEEHGTDSRLQNGANRKRVTFQLPEENNVRFKRTYRRNLKRTFLGRKNHKQM